MPWSLYKEALLKRMLNSSTIDGLISFILKPRDGNCPISLWVAERIAERHLLNDDGIEMSEDTWLELLLALSRMKKSKLSKCLRGSSVLRLTTAQETLPDTPSFPSNVPWLVLTLPRFASSSKVIAMTRWLSVCCLSTN